MAMEQGRGAEKRHIYSGRARHGSRYYFVDVVETAKAGRILTLSESQMTADGRHRERVMVFEEGVDEVVQILREGVRAMKTGQSASQQERVA